MSYDPYWDEEDKDHYEQVVGSPADYPPYLPTRGWWHRFLRLFGCRV